LAAAYREPIQMKASSDVGTFRRFLAPLSWSSQTVLFVAIFCLFGTFGFLTDIISVGRHSAPHVAFDVTFSGVMAALFAFVARSARLAWPMVMAQLASKPPRFGINVGSANYDCLS
jgi:hypothetical protein